MQLEALASTKKPLSLSKRLKSFLSTRVMYNYDLHLNIYAQFKSLHSAVKLGSHNGQTLESRASLHIVLKRSHYNNFCEKEIT